MVRKYIDSNKAEKGFTMVEILVSILLLSITVIAFANSMGFSFTSIFLMGQKRDAITEAQNKLEYIYARSLEAESVSDEMDDLKENDDEYIESLDDPDELGATVENGKRFTIKETTNEIDGEDIEGFKVIVMVFYKDGDSYVDLNTFIEGEHSS